MLKTHAKQNKPEEQELPYQPQLVYSQRRSTPRTHCRGLSRLELLPAELIEKIFFHCFEPAFALASPRVAQVLSREPIYHALMILAFCDGDWEFHCQSWFSILTKFSHDLDIDIRYEHRENLQRSLLKCRWFTFERLRQLQTDVLTTFMKSSWLDKTFSMDEHERHSLSAFLRHFEKSEPLTWTSREFNGTTCAGKRARLRIEYGPGLRIFIEHDTAEISFPGKLMAIPESLVSGTPWTREKTLFLDSLTKYFAIPSRLDSLSPSELIETHKIQENRPDTPKAAIRQGIKSAIIEGDTEALDILLKYFDETSPSVTKFNTKRDIQDAMSMVIGENLINTYIPPNIISPDHFLTAARHRSDSFVMKILIKYGSESFPGDNPEVWQYATNLKRKNDTFGDVLLDYYLVW